MRARAALLCGLAPLMVLPLSRGTAHEGRERCNPRRRKDRMTIRVIFEPWTAPDGQVQQFDDDVLSASEQLEFDVGWLHVVSYNNLAGVSARQWVRSYPAHNISSVSQRDEHVTVARTEREVQRDELVRWLNGMPLSTEGPEYHTKFDFWRDGLRRKMNDFIEEARPS